MPHPDCFFSYIMSSAVLAAAMNKIFTPRSFDAIGLDLKQRLSSSNSGSETESDNEVDPQGSGEDSESDYDYPVVLKQPSPKTPPLESISLASYNLRSYLEYALLPPINHKKVKEEKPTSDGAADRALCPEPPRGAMVGKIEEPSFRDCIILYQNYGIYGPEDFPLFRLGIGQPVDPKTEALRLPAKIMKNVILPEYPFHRPSCPTTVRQVATWILNGPLKTAQRALHLSNFQTRRWWFERANVRNSQDKNTVWAWRFHPETAEERDQELGQLSVDLMSEEQSVQVGLSDEALLPEITLAVIIELPWDSREQSQDGGIPVVFKPWHRALAACRELDTNYFIITTYEGWVFGRFMYVRVQDDQIDENCELGGVGTGTEPPSDGKAADASIFEDEQWNVCVTTPVLKYNAREPSIMQALTYWIARSMSLDYTDVLPLGYSYPPPTPRAPPQHPNPQNPDTPAPAPRNLPVIEISRPDRFKTPRPHPKLPSGLLIPITQQEETQARDNPAYLRDLEELGLASLAPEAVLAEFQARVEEYFASDYKTRNACLDIRPPKKS